MRKIKIIMDGKEVTTELIDRNPKTAGAVWNALPIQSRIDTWGDEIYFGTMVKVDEENAQEKVEVGDVAYWPEGGCVCIFFGKTPASDDEKPKAYSQVPRVRGSPILQYGVERTLACYYGLGFRLKPLV